MPNPARKLLLSRRPSQRWREHRTCKRSALLRRLRRNKPDGRDPLPNPADESYHRAARWTGIFRADARVRIQLGQRKLARNPVRPSGDRPSVWAAVARPAGLLPTSDDKHSVWERMPSEFRAELAAQAGHDLYPYLRQAVHTTSMQLDPRSRIILSPVGEWDILTASAGRRPDSGVDGISQAIGSARTSPLS
jgi:hypothetical protein